MPSTTTSAGAAGSVTSATTEIAEPLVVGRDQHALGVPGDAGVAAEPAVRQLAREALDVAARLRAAAAAGQRQQRGEPHDRPESDDAPDGVADERTARALPGGERAATPRPEAPARREEQQQHQRERRGVARPAGALHAQPAAPGAPWNPLVRASDPRELHVGAEHDLEPLGRRIDRLGLADLARAHLDRVLAGQPEHLRRHASAGGWSTTPTTSHRRSGTSTRGRRTLPRSSVTLGGVARRHWPGSRAIAAVGLGDADERRPGCRPGAPASRSRGSRRSRGTRRCRRR